jgi:hypothetical protein
MATIRRLRGRWQAQVRCRSVPPRAKSLDRRSDAERWGFVSDTRFAEKTTRGELLGRYRAEVTPTKSAGSEKVRIGAFMRRDICHRTLAKLTSVPIDG